VCSHISNAPPVLALVSKSFVATVNPIKRVEKLARLAQVEMTSKTGD
jgi:hypothetical protein